MGLLTVAFVLGLFNQVNVFAYEPIQATEFHEEHVVEDEEIIPYGLVCIKCGGNCGTSVHYGSWQTIEKTCTHYPHGTDEWRKRTVYTDYICSSCGYLVKTLTSTETEYVDCHGWY